MVKLSNTYHLNLILNYIFNLDRFKLVQMVLDQNATHIMTTLYDNIFEIQVLMSNIFEQYNKELMGNK